MTVETFTSGSEISGRPSLSTEELIQASQDAFHEKNFSELMHLLVEMSDRGLTFEYTPEGIKHETVA